MFLTVSSSVVSLAATVSASALNNAGPHALAALAKSPPQIFIPSSAHFAEYCSTFSATVAIIIMNDKGSLVYGSGKIIQDCKVLFFYMLYKSYCYGFSIFLTSGSGSHIPGIARVLHVSKLYESFVIGFIS